MSRKNKIYPAAILLLAGIFLLFFVKQSSTQGPLAPQTEGFHGDAFYTCEQCELPPECWTQGDKAKLYDVEQEFTGIQVEIGRVNGSTGVYSGLKPPHSGWWYVRGVGYQCRSQFYLAHWEAGTSARLDLLMDDDTPRE